MGLFPPKTRQALDILGGGGSSLRRPKLLALCVSGMLLGAASGALGREPLGRLRDATNGLRAAIIRRAEAPRGDQSAGELNWLASSRRPRGLSSLPSEAAARARFGLLQPVVAIFSEDFTVPITVRIPPRNLQNRIAQGHGGGIGMIAQLAFSNERIEQEAGKPCGLESGVMPRLKPGDVKALTGFDMEAINRVLLLHERFELQVKPKTYMPVLGHAHPAVVLRESNAAFSVAGELPDALRVLARLREQSGEAALFPPGLAYGRQRLSRHAIRRISLWVGRKVEKETQLLLKMAEAQKRPFGTPDRMPVAENSGGCE